MQPPDPSTATELHAWTTELHAWVTRVQLESAHLHAVARDVRERSRQIRRDAQATLDQSYASDLPADPRFKQ